MPGFKSIIDQKQPVLLLKTLFIKGSLPHALLFTGIDGVQKLSTAIALAMLCNCEKINSSQTIPFRLGKTGAKEVRLDIDSCGTCRSCRKIQSDNHPDIIHVKPSGNLIKIDQIRSLCNSLALKPYEADTRVIIISNAQTMNPEASNALLKILEEPPDKTLLILIALQALDLLTTIISRCQQIRFNPIQASSIAKHLIQEKKMTQDKAGLYAALSGGSFSRALKINKKWLRQRDWILTAPGLNRSNRQALPSVLKCLAFAEKLTKSKALVPLSLEILQTWLRDLIIFPYIPDKINNIDLINQIDQISRNTERATLLSKLDAVLEAAKNLQANTNLKLTLEIMALKLGGFSDPGIQEMEIN